MDREDVASNVEETDDFGDRSSEDGSEGEREDVSEGSDEDSEDEDFNIDAGGESSDSDRLSAYCKPSWLYSDMEMENDDIFRDSKVCIEVERGIGRGDEAARGNETGKGDEEARENEGERGNGDGPDIHLYEENMGEFNEEAPDLNDDLRSLQGSDNERLDQDMEFNENNTQLALGMRFVSGKQFRKALRAWAVDGGFAYVF